jgi:hypothetical protein
MVLTIEPTLATFNCCKMTKAMAGLGFLVLAMMAWATLKKLAGLANKVPAWALGTMRRSARVSRTMRRSVVEIRAAARWTAGRLLRGPREENWPTPLAEKI